MRAVVVGAGMYGLACAERMARGGADVTVVERAQPAHPQAASGGITRVLRFEYGDDERFTDLTIRARERWIAVGELTGRVLFDQRGVVHFARGEGDHAFERASYELVAARGLPIELVEPDELARRHPEFCLDGVRFGLSSPSGGILWARRATETWADLARAAGVTIRPGAEVLEAANGVVRLANGERLRGDVVVLCTSAWSSGIDPRLAPIVPRRQVTAYFDLDLSTIPVFASGLTLYGFPAHDGMGVKLALHRILDGEIGDPSDPALREPTELDIERIREVASSFLPGIATSAVEMAEVCYYAMTPDERPVIDWLDERTLVCAGLSGHGFKFSCTLGEHVGAHALGLDAGISLEGFELTRPVLL